MSTRAAFLGRKGGLELPDPVFTEPFHESLVHETARADLASRRRGTAATLTRAEVAMTTAKAWRQKGLGRARAGPLSVPHRRGGGVAFGPKPRRYAIKVNRKGRRRALRAALSVHAARDSIAVLAEGAFEEPSTRQAAGQLADWGAPRPTLVVLTPEETPAAKSFRNIDRVTVMPADAVGVADIVSAASLVISQPAIGQLARRAGGEAA